MGDFLTIYRQDYVKKPITIERSKPMPQIFKDPIGEAYRSYLTINADDCKADPSVQPVDEFQKKFQAEHEKLHRIYFAEPLDKRVVESDEKLAGHTVYEVDYCNVEKKLRAKLSDQAHNNQFRLPDNWRLPETSHEIEFRDPSTFAKTVVCPPSEKTVRPVSRFRLGNAAFAVSPEVSTYEHDICELGGQIIEKHLHGPLNFN